MYTEEHLTNNDSDINLSILLKMGVDITKYSGKNTNKKLRTVILLNQGNPDKEACIITYNNFYFEDIIAGKRQSVLTAVENLNKAILQYQNGKAEDTHAVLLYDKEYKTFSTSLIAYAYADSMRTTHPTWDIKVEPINKKQD